MREESQLVMKLDLPSCAGAVAAEASKNSSPKNLRGAVNLCAQGFVVEVSSDIWKNWQQKHF
jgi:hypothetical protein